MLLVGCVGGKEMPSLTFSRYRQSSTGSVVVTLLSDTRGNLGPAYAGAEYVWFFFHVQFGRVDRFCVWVLFGHSVMDRHTGNCTQAVHVRPRSPTRVQVFYANAWICACQATDRDLASKRCEKVNAWICASLTIDPASVIPDKKGRSVIFVFLRT